MMFTILEGHGKMSCNKEKQERLQQSLHFGGRLSWTVEWREEEEEEEESRPVTATKWRSDEEA